MLGAKLGSNPMLRPSQTRKSTQEIENKQDTKPQELENNFDNMIRNSNPIVKKKKPKLKQMDFDEKPSVTKERDSVKENLQNSPKKNNEKKVEEDFILNQNKINLEKDEEKIITKVENKNIFETKHPLVEQKKNIFDEKKSDTPSQEKKKNIFDEKKSDTPSQEKKKNIFDDVPEKEATVTNKPTVKKSVFDFDDTDISIPIKKQENKEKDTKGTKNNKIQFLFDE
jgi:hypothetical protein